MIPYILHVSILIAGCYIFYWLLLRKETFFKLNRGVLIACLLIPMVLPLVTIPASWALQIFPTQQISHNTPTSFAKKELKDSTMPIQQTEIREVETPIPLEPTHSNKTIETGTSPLISMSVGQQLFYLYWIGVIVFAIAFLIQLVLILAKIASLNSMQDGKYKIVELVKDEAPYSFWNTIFINPAKYDSETYEQILAHEKIHIDQTHYVDMLLVELAVIAFWFNPFVWLFRKAITNNLEFLTDESMLTQGFPKQSYQMSLLKVSVPQYPLNLTTNYNQSFLKNRIAMMNTKKSSARSVWKYLFILPLLGFSIMSLNAVDNSSNKTNTSPELEEEIIAPAPEKETSSESEENKELKEEVMTNLEKDNLLDSEDPVFKLFPNKILLNDKPLNSKLRKKYKAIFQKYGINHNKSKLLIVKPLVVMSGSFVGNENAENGTNVEVFEEEENQEPDEDKITLHTTTTTTTTTTNDDGDSDERISVTSIDGLTYVQGVGKHNINGQMYNIKKGEVTVIDEDGSSYIIYEQDAVDKALKKVHEKARKHNLKKKEKSSQNIHIDIGDDNDSKVDRQTVVVTNSNEEGTTSRQIEIITKDGKTYVNNGDELILIEQDGDITKLIQGDVVDQGIKNNQLTNKHKRYLEDSRSDGNFHFLHPSDILTSSNNDFWKLPTFCKKLNNALVKEGTINSGEKFILYYAGSDGIFVNGQHLTGDIVDQFEMIASQNNIPLSNGFHFEMNRNQVIILDQINSVNIFRQRLLDQLASDNFISNKRKKMVMEISGNAISVNGKEIPANKYAAYFILFKKYNIVPSPGKIIETSKKSGKENFQIGYKKDNAMLGTFVGTF